MRLVQITSPEGAVSLLNVDLIKSIVPFGDGKGCTIQLMGDPEWKNYKSSVDYNAFMLHLSNFDVKVCYPNNDAPDTKTADVEPQAEIKDHSIRDNLLKIESLTGELEAERSRALGFRIVLCSVLTSIGRRSLDPKRFISIITKAIEDVPTKGHASSRRAVLELGQQMVLRSTGR